SGLGDLWMIDKGALHFHCADAMSSHVQHVVHAAEQPEESVSVPLRAVTGEIHVRSPSAPVLLHVSVGVAVELAQHRWPLLREREQATARALHTLSLVGFDLRGDAGECSR